MANHNILDIVIDLEFSHYQFGTKLEFLLFTLANSFVIEFLMVINLNSL